MCHAQKDTMSSLGDEGGGKPPNGSTSRQKLVKRFVGVPGPVTEICPPLPRDPSCTYVVWHISVYQHHIYFTRQEEKKKFPRRAAGLMETTCTCTEELQSSNFAYLKLRNGTWTRFQVQFGTSRVLDWEQGNKGSNPPSNFMLTGCNRPGILSQPTSQVCCDDKRERYYVSCPEASWKSAMPTTTTTKNRGWFQVGMSMMNIYILKLGSLCHSSVHHLCTVQWII